MNAKERELWARLTSVKEELITPYEDHGALELMSTLVKDPTSILRLIDLCSTCDNPGFVNRCVARLSAYERESRFSVCLLQAWVQLAPAILRTWLAAPESMSTALGSIEEEFRASYPLGPPDVDCYPLSALVLDSLVPRELPRLRDDIYMQAISLIGFLLEHSWLTRLFPTSENADLASRISAVLPWLRSHGYPAKGGGIVTAYEDDIAAAERIIKALTGNDL